MAWRRMVGSPRGHENKINDSVCAENSHRRHSLAGVHVCVLLARFKRDLDQRHAASGQAVGRAACFRYVFVFRRLFLVRQEKGELDLDNHVEPH